MPQKWDTQAAQAEGGGDALVQQIPGENIIDFAGAALGLVQRDLHGLRLQAAFGFFPAGFAKGCVLIALVEVFAQGAFALLSSANGSKAHDDGAVFHLQGVFPNTLDHINSFLLFP
ncbi:Uncharacterised protein [uncultured Ruminococcus sp.]|nr:Uncharacterised protein [uncultured Ruminococcus sp.]